MQFKVLHYGCATNDYFVLINGLVYKILENSEDVNHNFLKHKVTSFYSLFLLFVLSSQKQKINHPITLGLTEFLGFCTVCLIVMCQKDSA